MPFPGLQQMEKLFCPSRPELLSAVKLKDHIAGGCRSAGIAHAVGFSSGIENHSVRCDTLPERFDFTF
jgi:hypothetical protein